MVNIERKEDGYKKFFGSIKGKTVAVVSDANTKPFADDVSEEIGKRAKKVVPVFFDDKDLVPDESVYETVIKEAGKAGAEYILAVGSGSLNDVCKYAATVLGVKSGVLATAASMDGYLSKGSALMKKGFKVTETVNMPENVLIDADILAAAPRILTASGFGDIAGKYTCLTDWKMSNALNGEPINEKAYSMMEEARTACMDSFDELVDFGRSAVVKLTDALLCAGLSMAECGNSRPASGSEHHMSHFLEMDFVKRGERIPPHGVKVAIGTLVSIELYNYIKDNEITFSGSEKVYRLADALPKTETLGEMYGKIGLPTRFSDIGVRKDVMAEMMRKAYTVRDRYTVLTLVHDLGLTEKTLPSVMDKYY